jgi:hypothetical protein
MLAAALVVTAVNWTPESCRAIALTDNGQSLAAQEEKPFDQKQTLAELRKKIAGFRVRGLGPGERVAQRRQLVRAGDRASIRW